MTKASDNIFPKVTFVEGSAPASPAASDFSLYFDVSDHLLKWKNSAGSITTISTGSGFSDPMTTRGDIIIRNASNVTDRLGRGGSGTVLSSDGTDVSWQTPASGGTDNWHYEIACFLGSHGNTNWTTASVPDTGEFYTGDIESSGAQNDEIYWDIGLSGGTWDFTLLHHKASNRGIYTVSIDGSSIGTIDGYNGTSVKNVLSVITGTSVTAGKRRLKLKMATKNGSASNYFGTVGAIQLRRTA